MTPLLSGNNPINFEDFFSVNRLGTPVVSPDGEKIAFTVKKGNINDNNYTTQIWLTDSDGNNLKQLTTHSSASLNPVFSPDGKSLYFLSSRSESGQIWKISLAGGDPQQVSDVYGDIEEFILSLQNSHFIFVRKVLPGCENEDCIKQKGEMQKNNPVKARVIDGLMYRHWNSWLEGHFSHLFLLSLDGKAIKDLTPGPYHTPPISLGSSHDYSFSPDGKEICYVTNTDNEIGKFIAYTSMERAGFEADRQRIMLYDRDSKETKELTIEFILSVGEILWAPDSKKLFFTTEEAGNNSIYKVSIEDTVIESVLKGHNVKGLTFLNPNTLVFSKQTNKLPFEIFSYDLKNKEGNKYPAVHLIHGGPQGMWSNEWHFRWNYQMFASPGYVVYYINFHGSSGYGQKFTDSISQHWGDLPYEDIVKATEYVIKHYDYVDPDRLGAAGASYGGSLMMVSMIRSACGARPKSSGFLNGKWAEYPGRPVQYTGNGLHPG
jgi:dipeptidyl aminopeptidase/acylaminoacyl peptidase